jgi:uncharacterized protein YwgA
MATTIEGDYDFDKYPWSQWLDGQTWRLSNGDDFRVKPTTLVGYAKKAAKERGLALDSKIESETTVVLRARRPNR